MTKEENGGYLIGHLFLVDKSEYWGHNYFFHANR